MGKIEAKHAVERIAKDSLLFGALYLGAVILLHRGIAPLDQIASLLREMTPRAKSSKPLPAFSEATVAARATSVL